MKNEILLFVAIVVCLPACRPAFSTDRPGARAQPAPRQGAAPAASPTRAKTVLPAPAIRRQGRQVCVSLHPLKRRWWLGENILIHFQVKNCGTLPFKVSFGGDYRGASRHLRFKVRATDQNGQLVADPDPTGFNMGGLSSSPQLKPGESFFHTLPLARYARFEKAGVYRVRIAHDLGWKGRPSKGQITANGPRWAETRIQLRMPTPKQAAQVVHEMAALPTDPNSTFGKKSRNYADFTSLRYAVYLPILLRRTQTPKGDIQALWGISQIPTPAATAALLKLARHPNQKFAQQAVGSLSYRLPDPLLQGKLGPRNPFFNCKAPQRRYMIKRAWRARFAPAVRALARQQLAAQIIAPVRSGAFLLEAVGTKAELPALIKGLDWAVAHTQKLALETRLYPRPRGACQELLRAVRMLLARGAVAPHRPRTPGEIVVYLAAWGPKPVSQRPAQYARLALGWLSHSIDYLRELVLTFTQPPLPRRMLLRLSQLLKSKSVDLQIAACKAVTHSKQPRFRRVVLQQIAGAEETFFIGYLTQAALALKIPRDQLALAWAKRLSDPKMTRRFFGQLLMLIDHHGSSGMDAKIDRTEASRLEQRWLRFIKKQTAAIRAGERFRIGDPRLTPDLLPKSYQFYRAGKPPWPPLPRP
ncbi:MAG: hypothetical protein ABI333_13615 [bacterium]